MKVKIQVFNTDTWFRIKVECLDKSWWFNKKKGIAVAIPFSQII